MEQMKSKRWTSTAVILLFGSAALHAEPVLPSRRMHLRRALPIALRRQRKCPGRAPTRSKRSSSRRSAARKISRRCRSPLPRSAPIPCSKGYSTIPRKSSCWRPACSPMACRPRPASRTTLSAASAPPPFPTRSNTAFRPSSTTSCWRGASVRAHAQSEAKNIWVLSFRHRCR